MRVIWLFPRQNTTQCNAGIRLAPGGGGLTRTWVVYNKPKTPNYTHAGMLMGLGLAGTGNAF